MKICFVICLVSVIVAQALYAQTPTRTPVPIDSNRSDLSGSSYASRYGGSDAKSDGMYSIYAGLHLYGKAGMNVQVAHGYKTNVNFNSLPDVGLTVFIPFEKKASLGAGFDLGYSTLGYRTRQDTVLAAVNKYYTIVERNSYLNFFPHFNLGGLVIGMNMDFPMSSSVYSGEGRDTSVIIRRFPFIINQDFRTDSTAKSVDYLRPIFELRLGLSIPIIDESWGRVNANALVGYTLTPLYKESTHEQYLYAWDKDPDNPEKSPRIYNSANNPQIVTIGIGFTFMGRIPLFK